MRASCIFEENLNRWHLALNGLSSSAKQWGIWLAMITMGTFFFLRKKFYNILSLVYTLGHLRFSTWYWHMPFLLGLPRWSNSGCQARGIHRIPISHNNRVLPKKNSFANSRNILDFRTSWKSPFDKGLNPGGLVSPVVLDRLVCQHSERRRVCWLVVVGPSRDRIPGLQLTDIVHRTSPSLLGCD